MTDFTSQEVAERIGVPMSTLKSWAVRLSVPSTVGEDGTRRFSEEALVMLEAVKHLREEERSYATIRRTVLPTPVLVELDAMRAEEEAAAAGVAPAVPMPELELDAPEAAAEKPPVVPVILGVVEAAPVEAGTEPEVAPDEGITLDALGAPPELEAVVPPEPELEAEPVEVLAAAPHDEVVMPAIVLETVSPPPGVVPRAEVPELRVEAPPTTEPPVEERVLEAPSTEALPGEEVAAPEVEVAVSQRAATVEAKLERMVASEQVTPDLAVVMARVLEVLGEQHALSESYASARQRVGELESALRIAHDDRVRLQAELAEAKRELTHREQRDARRKPWFYRLFDFGNG